jgi:hypothetical protein
MRYITKILFLCAAALVFTGRPASAEYNEVLANMAAEAATCAVYVSLGERIAIEMNRPEEVARFHDRQGKLLMWARTLTVLAGLPETTVNANIELARQKMLAILDGDTLKNADILIGKYRQLCETVYTNAGKRAQYWIDRSLGHQ